MLISSAVVNYFVTIAMMYVNKCCH